jgi:hypothetical protein
MNALICRSQKGSTMPESWHNLILNIQAIPERSATLSLSLSAASVHMPL